MASTVFLSKPVPFRAVPLDQVVKLDAKGMATHMSTDKDTKEMGRWESALTQALTSKPDGAAAGIGGAAGGGGGGGGGYVLVGKQQLVGVLVFVFAAAELAPKIKRVQTSTVACGVGGVGGNKGGACEQ
eukprot:SAG22_NODE_265_length_13348_cov_150.719149_15_plen_129_part_00